jgi:hypothetical protein
MVLINPLGNVYYFNWRRLSTCKTLATLTSAAARTVLARHLKGTMLDYLKAGNRMSKNRRKKKEKKRRKEEEKITEKEEVYLWILLKTG